MCRGILATGAMIPDWFRHCRSFIDAVGDQMIVIGEDYRILLANKAL